VATFYVARSEIITPLPWQTFALPFSKQRGALTVFRKATPMQVVVGDRNFHPLEGAD
jgi:hypothetical protein